MTFEVLHVRPAGAIVMGMRTTCLVLALALITGCVPPALRSVQAPKDVPPGRVVVVGKVELWPPLRAPKGAQGPFAAAEDDFVLLLLDEKPGPVDSEPPLSEYRGRIEARLGDTFFVSRRADPFHIRAGFLVAGSQDGPRKLHLPGGLKVTIKPGDQAVYVGTLRFVRDEAFTVKKAVVADEYDQAASDFHKKFGGLTLRRALASKG